MDSDGRWMDRPGTNLILCGHIFVETRRHAHPVEIATVSDARIDRCPVNDIRLKNRLRTEESQMTFDTTAAVRVSFMLEYAPVSIRQFVPCRPRKFDG